MQAESVIKLMDKFDSPEFKVKRETAAHACLEHLEGKNPAQRSRIFWISSTM
jgi:hypothetical protein